MISIHALLAESDQAANGLANAPPKISIHALLAESDTVLTLIWDVIAISIHALLAESDLRVMDGSKSSIISIHALLAESDNGYGQYYIRARISIHALLAESDHRRGIRRYLGAHFYPRSPCGERLVDAVKLAGTMLFLSTLSLRRATIFLPIHREQHTISIHALLAESDTRKDETQQSDRKFLSTLSLRRATRVIKLIK